MNKTTESSNSQGYYIAWLIVFIVQSFTITILNLLTLMTITLNAHLRRRRSLFCIAHLSVADLIFGIISMPSFIVEYIWRNLGWFSIPVRYVIYLRASSIFAGLASISFLALICIERCYVTFYPFKSRTTPLATYVIGVSVTWIISLIAGITFMVRLQPFLVLIAWLLGSTCIIGIGYLAIYFKMKRQSQQRQEMSGGQNTTREKELAKTLFIVTVSSIVCWVPFMALNFMSYSKIQFSESAWYSAKVLQATNSLINPVIYQLKMNDVRKATLSLATR